MMRKTYRAKHILLESLEDSEYVLKKLRAGEKFEELAKNFSECDSSKKGGDLGNFFSGQMVAEFERAVDKLEVGEISAPVLTKFGFHIIKRL